MLSVLSVSAKDKYHLILEGSFLQTKNVSYTVYVLEKDGSLNKLYNTKCIKYYTIVCDVDRTYIIKFTSGNLIKTLMVNVTKSGTFYLDVDFNKKIDAHLIFDNNIPEGYRIDPLDKQLLVNL